jgi:chemotaxis protein MotA
MDKLAFAGFFLAIIAIFGGYAIEGGGVNALFHFPAFLIVIGGSFGAVMLQTPMRHFTQGLAMFPLIWRNETFNFNLLLSDICHWSDIARQKGFLALEETASHTDDPFVKKGLNMIIDGIEVEIVKDALELDIELESDDRFKSARIYEALGGYSPTIGIIGAVLGLIQAMANIDDPNALGQGIATAFVATIYGVGGANLFFIPVAKKLQTQVEREVMYREMVVEGLIATSSGENPQSIARKLEAYTKFSH